MHKQNVAFIPLIMTITVVTMVDHDQLMTTNIMIRNIMLTSILITSILAIIRTSILMRKIYDDKTIMKPVATTLMVKTLLAADSSQVISSIDGDDNDQQPTMTMTI